MKPSSNMSFVDKFFLIEAELFELKSPEGVYYWDVFRHAVSGVVLYNLSKGRSVQPGKQSFSSLVGKLLKAIPQSFCILKKYDNIVFAASRNRHDGLYFDQQIYGLLPYLKKNKTLVVETYNKQVRRSYQGFDYRSSFGIFRRLVRPHYEKIDFRPLASRLNDFFETNYFDHAYFSSLYHNFWVDYTFYKFIFKRMCIRNVYMSQNGIQKGLFKVAREMNINVYEFQHGVIDKTHMAYSYPHLAEIEKKTYLPTYLLKLSDYWLNDCFMPYTRQITLGNDYFFPTIYESVEPNPQKVLVISNSVHGSYLHDFLIRCVNKNPEFLSYNFIFKLHPAEYSQVDDYKRLFCNYKNVSVVTNEKTIAQWMSECATMLLIQSTSAYEALQCGRNVAVLKELSWKVMEPIFQEKNTHLIDTPEAFMTVLKQKADASRPLYFQHLSHQTIQTII